jgi:16S rRNA (cytosine1402-N4)-methyltransferase
MHVPVLLKQAIEYLKVEENKNFIDCTAGAGGHSLEILKNINQGKVLSIDANPSAIRRLKERISDLRIDFICGNFFDLKEIVKKNDFHPVNGILLDLGLSSELLEESGLGFSFMRQEKLDMRFNPETQTLTAAEILNHFSENDLAEIFKNYGGERFYKRIAERIIWERQKQEIIFSHQLVDIIKKSLGRYFHIKSLARVFQALRICVNEELKVLEAGLKSALEILEPGGRLVVISYHSLEDKIVKNLFRAQKQKLNILTKKPITPNNEEIGINKKSRSAKLRAIEIK